MLFLISLTLIFASISNILGQSCPEFKAYENFDLKSFAKGKWYEIARYSGFAPEERGKCVQFDYTIEQFVCIVKEVVDKKNVQKKLVAQMAPDAGNTARILYTYEGGSDILSILDLDYNNYAIFYACTIDEATKTPRELAWIISRTPSLSPEIKAKVDKFLENHPNIDAKKMMFDIFNREECLRDL